MNYLIIGTGGVGGCIAGFLALAGKDVTCIARGKHLEAIRRQGLADYLNADRSALSSELSKLQKEGVLSYKKNTFSLRV
jgi:ketopantoate reductase